MFCARRCASTRTCFQQHWGRLSLYFALQVKLSEFMMEYSGEFYSDINFFHRVVQNQLSQKIPQASHVMSTPLSLMESRSELSSDIIFSQGSRCPLHGECGKVWEAKHIMNGM